MTTPFIGTWRIDVEGSKVWDYATKTWLPEGAGEEIIRIGGDDEVQDYEVLYGDRPVVRMGYTSRFDDTTWVPYTIRGVEGVPEEEIDDALLEFQERVRSMVAFRIGGIYGLVRSVLVDERTHYRLSKNAETGEAEYSMLRRMEPDGQAYLATVLRVDGVVSRVRRFVRVES
jgi:hypothetical protein